MRKRRYRPQEKRVLYCNFLTLATDQYLINFIIMIFNVSSFVVQGYPQSMRLQRRPETL